MSLIHSLTTGYPTDENSHRLVNDMHEFGNAA